MNANEKLIQHFYTCFQQHDYKGMQACYADNATFSDAVFKDLDSAQVKSMWQMLIAKGKDLRLEFSDIVADDHDAKAHWNAFYTFSASKRKVVNRIDASFEIEHGKIVKHIDHFNFYTWSKQALGLTGFLLGWTGFLQQKVSRQAMANLADFIAKNKD